MQPSPVHQVAVARELRRRQVGHELDLRIWRAVRWSAAPGRMLPGTGPASSTSASRRSRTCRRSRGLRSRRRTRRSRSPGWAARSPRACRRTGSTGSRRARGSHWVSILAVRLVRTVAVGPERVGERLSIERLRAGDARARLEVADLVLGVELVRPAPHGRMLFGAALEYSGWKLNGVPAAGPPGSVFMKPFAAGGDHEARLCRWSGRARSLRARDHLLGALASKMWMTIVSPGFISSVWRFGVTVARSDSCGLGGPVGTPLCWMNAKLTGSMQFRCRWKPSGLHSRLSMVSAEHQ